MALTFKGQRFALLKTAPGGFFIRSHPWRSPFRPTLCVVKNRSRRFFILCDPARLAVLFRPAIVSGFITRGVA
jgi:hypothetical protein